MGRRNDSGQRRCSDCSGSGVETKKTTVRRLNPRTMRFEDMPGWNSSQCKRCNGTGQV